MLKIIPTHCISRENGEKSNRFFCNAEKISKFAPPADGWEIF
jgi:hypothetical protein